MPLTNPTRESNDLGFRLEELGMMARLCWTWSFSVALAAILLPACSGETQTTVRLANVFRGTVTDLDTGANLLTFCATEGWPGDRYAEVVRFKAASGLRVREDIQWEQRSDRIEGPAPPQRTEAFWCAGGGVASRTALLFQGWACKTAVQPDPAAIVEDVQPLGVIDGGRATGYSLTLRVVHPGTVQTEFEEQCSITQYGRVEPVQIREATIDPA